MRHRFYARLTCDKEAILPPDESFHLTKVLKIKEDQDIEIFDDKGGQWIAKIITTTPLVRVQIISEDKSTRCPSVKITCASAIPKAKRFNFMLQKLCELGLQEFIPVEFSRSIARFTENKKQKAERICIQAVKQSKSATVCQIKNPISCMMLADIIKSVPLCYLLSAYARDRLIDVFNKNATSILYIVGPEGGLTKEEEQILLDAGAKAVKLTQTILRIETAAISALSVLTQMYS